MRTAWTLILPVLLAVPAANAEDGGVLVFRSSIAPTAPTLWPVNAQFSSAGRAAMMQLDRDSPEKVMLAARWPLQVQMALSVSKPERLYCDSNSDGRCQAGEVYSATAGGLIGKTFKNVQFPSHIGGVTQTLSVNVEALSYSSRSTRFEISEIRSCYQGDLKVGKATYPACLAYRSLEPRNGTIEGLILVDSNRDGSFDHFHDPWITCNGIGFLEGELWTAQTSFGEATATVSLSRYQGDTGILKVTGDGLLRLYLGIRSLGNQSPPRESPLFNPSLSNPPFLSMGDRADICLATQTGGSYRLPVGRYQISKAWLGSSTSTATYYELNKQRPFSLAKDATTTEPLGGPLTLGLSTSGSSSILGYVYLNLKEFTNPAGWTFRSVTLPGILTSTRPEAPRFEIRNNNGRVVTVGKFQYG